MKRRNRVAMFNILSTVLLNGISIITGPLFSSMLGDSGFGVLKIYNIWASVAAILLTLQTQGTLVNARVEYSEEEQKRYQSSVMSMSVLMFLGCSAVIAVFLKPISRLLKLEPLLIGLMLVQAFGTFCINFLNTKNTYEFKAGRNMVLSLSVTLTTLVLSVVLILQLPQEIKYYGRVTAIALTYALVGIPACLLILLRGKTFYHREYWKFCFVLAIPAVFHNLSDLVLGQIDQVMLQHMVGMATVGHYGYAWQFANILFILFGALNKTWCPFFFEEMKQGKRDAMMNKTRNFLELFTILACGFILLAPEVYHVYAQDRDFWVSTGIIPLFVASYYINFLCTFPVNFEYYHKKTRVVAAVTIGSSLVNAVLNYALIKAVGMSGAALATVISHALQLMLHYVYTRYFLGRGDYPFPVKLWAKYAVGFAVILAVVFLTPDAWLIRWGIGAVLGVFELLQIRKRRVLI
ncbi:MAG: oligosaccharide flippase family protein [Oscillospiraceae bacterium]|nr:oligosaccharide flippase family protein [Oscillospiraceae bacterium]